MKPLRVCIDARLTSGLSGGVEQFTIGLASGLTQLPDGSEEYFFLTYEDAQDWLLPFLGDRGAILVDSPPPMESSLKHLLRRLHPTLRIKAPTSSGLIERLGMDVIHFPSQAGFLTGVPSLYHPHDLQHIHLPDFFSPQERRKREVVYRALCAQAEFVVVASRWVQQDVISHYRLNEEKVRVVPLAAPLDVYPAPSAIEVSQVCAALRVPDSFIFYPAHTWPHKNHLGLLRALAHLRDRYALHIPLVCSGRMTEHMKEIEAFTQNAGLANQVTFLGFVSASEVAALYQAARAVVIPTKFEASSFPMMEAFSAGTPVACSNVTSLPEQAGDAALIFDPADPEDIAQSIRRLWTDESLRRTLIERGRRRQRRFTWTDTSQVFRAFYRRIAGRALSDEDARLVSLP